MKAIMKEDLSRWVNSLTKLELALYNIDKDSINKWLDLLEDDAMPHKTRLNALQNLITAKHKGTHNED